MIKSFLDVFKEGWVYWCCPRVWMYPSGYSPLQKQLPPFPTHNRNDVPHTILYTYICLHYYTLDGWGLFILVADAGLGLEVAIGFL